MTDDAAEPRTPPPPLDLDAMARICEEAAHAAREHLPRSPMASSPTYAAVIEHLPTGAPAPRVAARLFADCYDAAAAAMADPTPAAE